MLVEEREVVFECPLLDLSRVAIWMAVVVVAVPIPLVQPLLVFTLHLVIQDDAVDVCVACVEPLGYAQIGLVDLGVVFELTLPFQPSVELLASIGITSAVMFQQVPSTVRQHYRDVASAVQPDGVDQTLLARRCPCPRPVVTTKLRARGLPGVFTGASVVLLDPRSACAELRRARGRVVCCRLEWP
jgi:hypothetical protein